MKIGVTLLAPVMWPRFTALTARFRLCITIMAAIPLNLLMISMSKPRNYCLTAYLLDRPFWGTTRQEPDRSAEEVTRHKYSQHDIIIQCALFVKQISQMESHRSVHYIQPKP